MPVLGVIPARLGATRLPRKPLQLLAGKPLVVRVLERGATVGVDELVVATDSEEIERAVVAAGGRAVLTAGHHASGTERVAEVAARAEFRTFDLVLNLQGDAPFLPVEAALGSIQRVRAGAEVGTAAAPLDAREVANPARVKVVMDLAGRALYFSRAPIPHRGGGAGVVAAGLYWQHLGVYAYGREALARWVRLPPVPCEVAEGLEQLRPLVHGFCIGVVCLAGEAPPAIDTADDLARAEAGWHHWHGGTDVHDAG